MENVENLLIEYLKAIRADISVMKSDIKEHTQRLGRIEISISGLRREMALRGELERSLMSNWSQS